MHHITRRLSPSLILAIGALLVALSGTAAAAVIITSPDQLGDDVVTTRAIKDRAVTQLRESHPHLRARVAVDGAGRPKLLAGDVNTISGLKSIATGQVRVTFDTANTLGGGRNLSTCAFTATPEAAKTGGVGPLKKLRVYTAPMFASSTSVDVVMLEDRDDGTLPVDAGFSLVADC